MATGYIALTVLDVGQGQCTFLEIYDDTTPTAKLVQTVLMDCGSDKPSDDTDTNLDYIVERVSSMAKPAFDCIIFSHSDKDHVNLTQGLLEKFKPSKKPAVKAVIYGGDYDQYKKYGTNILDYLQTNKYCKKKDINSPGSYKTSYNDTTGKFDAPLWESSDKAVKIQALVANVLSDDPDWDSNDEELWGAKAEEKNRVSIICGVYYAGSSYVICGDATNITMSSTNQLFKGTTVFNTNAMTTLPHHGSRATGFAVTKDKNPSAAAVKVVDTFAKLLKSRILTVSAFEKHRHPSLQLMNAFLPTLTEPFLRDARLKEKNTHRLTAYVDVEIEVKDKTVSSSAKKKVKKSGEVLIRDVARSFDSNTCTFTTRYTNAATIFSYNLGNSQCETTQGVKDDSSTGTVYDINPHACWQWIGYADGSRTVGGYSNLELPLTVFTSGATAVAIQPGELGRRAVWEFDKDGNEISGKENKPSPVTVRTKTSSTRQPASSLKQFQRLQQFY